MIEIPSDIVCQLASQVGYHIVETSVLGGLHHEYRLVKGGGLNDDFCSCGPHRGLVKLLRFAGHVRSGELPRSCSIMMGARIPETLDVAAHTGAHTATPEAYLNEVGAFFETNLK